MLQKQRYERKLWFYIDYISCILINIWVQSLNLFGSCYVITTKESKIVRFCNYVLKGPIFFVYCITLLPLGVLGFLLWIFVCEFGNPSSYAYLETPTDAKTNYQSLPDKNTFSIATANLCLLPEFLSKFNNNDSPDIRAETIASRILKGCVANRHEEEQFTITTSFSQLDFVCFQEVWERTSAQILISILKLHFNFFLFDVGEFSWKTNLFCLGSGLMFASKYPIIDVNFKSYHVKTYQNRASCLGLLQVKVALNADGDVKKVGYIATTHLQPYQGKKPCLLSELDEAVSWLSEFKKITENDKELICFDIFCGDFNFDNLSPGDRNCSEHHLFDKYVDPCRISVGEDNSWSIGTEMRQLKLWDNDIDSPEKFQKMLQDPILRRCFILDADVEIHTMELQLLKVPYDDDGKLRFSPVGGKRRIDYILYRKAIPLDVTHYSFICALNQLTDHIPISMTFKTQNNK